MSISFQLMDTFENGMPIIHVTHIDCIPFATAPSFIPVISTLTLNMLSLFSFRPGQLGNSRLLDEDEGFQSQLK